MNIYKNSHYEILPHSTEDRFYYDFYRKNGTALFHVPASKKNQRHLNLEDLGAEFGVEDFPFPITLSHLFGM